MTCGARHPHVGAPCTRALPHDLHVHDGQPALWAARTGCHAWRDAPDDPPTGPYLEVIP